jgi:D-alanine-D-alanine ligase-like ATP-grasp enzyme
LAKKIYGFKSKGMIKLNSQEELEEFIKNTNLYGYYIEQFHNYFREYRLHVTKDVCFYGLRKMIKEDTPEDKRWFRNDSNCIWILEENPSFDKPVNWDKIEKDCVKALEAVELDIGCFDVKVQSSTTPNGEKRLEPLYILIEVNSAPSMGEITIKKYKKAIPKLLMKKYETLLS